ncbi:phosphopentomutase [Alishewanella longhuensis]|uniref:Phosphopentomutase n=1 Tax=Alishewanella longhuensis TaxID=1091037 RepID=A0ABQ3KW84_9ALTE|nr:phosphopentomutase [Alishewanella longhuensis]GHG64789.1 phosphopentomutase [Alishewanella longhuensis]
MTKAVILVLDSFGIGSAPDAAKFGDVGANTFASIAKAFHAQKQRPLQLPNLARLGLVKAATAASNGIAPDVADTTDCVGAYGYARELSSGKDTPSGHWEIAGVPVLFDWGYFHEKTNSFPPELIDELCQRTGVPGILGNCHASGTDILVKLGDEHINSGKPICYTSADSVFQVAAHEEHFGLEKLLSFCETARELLDNYNIGRVIARPFLGTTAENYARTGNRRDYSVLPPAPTVLDKLTAAGGKVISIGKIADIYAHQGISESLKATGLTALVDKTLAQMAQQADNSLIFTNLVDFDQNFGHRRDPIGYGEALEYFDSRLPELMAACGEDTLMLLTADHGCDPTWPGTEHTREYVPVLLYKAGLKGVDLGERMSFADMGQTLADYYGLDAMAYGESFLANLH